MGYGSQPGRMDSCNRIYSFRKKSTTSKHATQLMGTGVVGSDGGVFQGVVDMKIRCPVHQPVRFTGDCQRDESARSLRWRLIKREFPLHINKSSLWKAKSTFVPRLFLQPTPNHLGSPLRFNFKLQPEFSYSSSPCYSHLCQASPGLLQ